MIAYLAVLVSFSFIQDADLILRERRVPDEWGGSEYVACSALRLSISYGNSRTGGVIALSGEVSMARREISLDPVLADLQSASYSVYRVIMSCDEGQENSAAAEILTTTIDRGSIRWRLSVDRKLEPVLDELGAIEDNNKNEAK